MKELKRDAYGRTILTYYICDEKNKAAVKMIDNTDIDINQSDVEGYTYSTDSSTIPLSSSITCEQDSTIQS